jgi:hypothetical protein
MKLIALSTGVELNLMRVNSSTGSVGSDPIRNIVVLKLEKLIRNATAKPLMSAGRRKGIVIYRIASSLVALRLKAASSRV